MNTWPIVHVYVDGCQETTLTNNCFVLSFSPKSPSCFTNRASSDASGTEWGGGVEGGGREERKERREGGGRER